MPHNQLAISSGSGSGRNPAVLMESLIDGGSAAASHRLHPMQQWRMDQLCLVGERSGQGTGLRGVRVGEASHPGPPRRRRRMELSLPATQVDSDTDDDERFLLPARPADAVRVEASPPREFDMAMDDSSAEESREADVGSSERQWVPRVPVENRFQVLSGQESDTESCEVSDRRRHRRLRLIWNPQDGHPPDLAELFASVDALVQVVWTVVM